MGVSGFSRLKDLSDWLEISERESDEKEGNIYITRKSGWLNNQKGQISWLGENSGTRKICSHLQDINVFCELGKCMLFE